MLERVRAAGVDGHRRPRPYAGARRRRGHGVDVRSRRRNIELDEARHDRCDGAHPGRHARRDLRPGPFARRRRHARQDDDDVDADADPRRGRDCGRASSSAATSPTSAPARSGPDRTWFVVEADESDGTHLELPLHGTILTNVEVDHLDHYGTFDGIVDGFDRYLGQIAGPKVVCGDDPIAAAPRRTPRRDHLRARPRASTSAPSTSPPTERRVHVRRIVAVDTERCGHSSTSSCRCAACTTW